MLTLGDDKKIHRPLSVARNIRFFWCPGLSVSPPGV